MNVERFRFRIHSRGRKVLHRRCGQLACLWREDTTTTNEALLETVLNLEDSTSLLFHQLGRFTYNFFPPPQRDGGRSLFNLRSTGLRIEMDLAMGDSRKVHCIAKLIFVNRWLADLTEFEYRVGRRARRRSLAEHPLHRLHQIVRIGSDDRTRKVRRSAADLLHQSRDGRGCLAYVFPWALEGHDLVHDASECPDVGGERVLLTHANLGRHVERGAHKGTTQVGTRRKSLGKTKVRQLEFSELADEDVLGLEVAMKHAFFMKECDGGSELLQIMMHLEHRETLAIRTVGLNHLVECSIGSVFHEDEHGPSVEPVVMNANDVLVLPDHGHEVDFLLCLLARRVSASSHRHLLETIHVAPIVLHCTCDAELASANLFDDDEGDAFVRDEVAARHGWTTTAIWSHGELLVWSPRFGFGPGEGEGVWSPRFEFGPGEGEVCPEVNFMLCSSLCFLRFLCPL